MTDSPTTGRSTSHERVGAQSVIHRRAFDATPAQVQQAHVDGDLFVQWMGPLGTTVRLDHWDASTGGAFAYAVVAGGSEWAFRGSYHEVTPERILHTWQYIGDDDVTLESLSFQAIPDGGCLLEVTSTYQSEAACDAMLAGDFDDGMDQNFERLDELLAGA